jgi:pimeloyl-ACP methyl ester carboxylesterase
VKLAYDLHSADHAPVLSGGLGTSRAMWDAQLRAFSRRQRVLRHDLPWHGAVSLSNAAHLANVEQPHAFSAAVLRHLEERVAA